MDTKEAIEHCYEAAERMYKDEPCSACAAEHEQLAHWLEELQAYRAKIPYDRLDEVAALVKAQNDGPCGLCRYSKPSSCDGKPCTMCPAEAQREEGQDTKSASSAAQDTTTL